ncbi:uncharacterized protein [Periplaneta americana]|uniref:uncharacterized protein n=1 Tax=Periplaneta americana TaxID=6978 RepID=UPI0037E804CB
MSNGSQLLPIFTKGLDHNTNVNVQMLLLQLLSLLSSKNKDKKCLDVEKEIEKERAARISEAMKCDRVQAQVNSLHHKECPGVEYRHGDLEDIQLQLQRISEEILDIEENLANEHEYTRKVKSSYGNVSVYHFRRMKEKFLPHLVDLVVLHKELRKDHQKYVTDLDKMRASTLDFFKSYQDIDLKGWKNKDEMSFDSDENT